MRKSDLIVLPLAFALGALFGVKFLGRSPIKEVVVVRPETTFSRASLSAEARRVGEVHQVPPKKSAPVPQSQRNDFAENPTLNIPSAETDSDVSDQRDGINNRGTFRMAAVLHGEAIGKLPIDEATKLKVLNLYADELRVSIDVGLAARKLGITNPDEIKRMTVQQHAKVTSEIQQVLGPDLYQAVGEERKIAQEKRFLDLQFSQELIATGDGLTSEQGYALARAVLELKSGAPTGRFPNSELLDSPEFAAATTILTAKQLESFKQYYRDGAFLETPKRITKQ